MLKSFKKLVTEHNFEHDLIVKKDYSEPKIFDAKGDLKKRWYVYFSFRNSTTGYLERVPNIYASDTLDAKSRIAYLKKVKSNLSEMLNDGFNPFEAEQYKVDKSDYTETKSYTINEAFEFGISLKKQSQNETTHTNFKSRVKRFELWLSKKGFEGKSILSITKKTINNYLNEVLQNSSARNRDNTRLDFSSLFQVLADNEIIAENIVSKTVAVGSEPNKNKPLTSTQEKAIFEYLDHNNKVMALFIRFVAFTFLRPVEVCRIKIKDIHLKDKTIHDETKTGFKIKIIPELLIAHLPDLTGYDSDSFMFGRTDFGQMWNSEANNRRNYYSKEFLKIKKRLNLGPEYGIYSFRHTFAIKIYNRLIKEMTPDEAESTLMSITGHETREALRKYLREINAYRPNDYSIYLE